MSREGPTQYKIQTPSLEMPDYASYLCNILALLDDSRRTFRNLCLKTGFNFSAFSNLLHMIIFDFDLLRQSVKMAADEY